MTLLNRQDEFKNLSKKSVYITFLFFNLQNINKIKEIVNVYNQYKQFCMQITSYLDSKNIAQRKEAEERMGDFATMSEEIMQVYLYQHIVNMVQKYKAKLYEQRRDAYYSARLAAAIAYQLIGDKKVIYKQFEYTLGEIHLYYSKQKSSSQGQPGEHEITLEELENYNRLKKMFRDKKMREQDLFVFQKQEVYCPKEVTEQFKKIDAIDPFEFKDGIDTESISYIYLNAFNQFRYENEVSSTSTTPLIP